MSHEHDYECRTCHVGLTLEYGCDWPAQGPICMDCLLDERNQLLETLKAARAELSNYTSTCVGGKNSSAIDCIADIDAAIAKALGEQ